MNSPAVLGLSPTVRVPLSNGDRGTVETIARIRKLIHAGATDQLVNRTSIAIIQAAGVPQFDNLGEIRALYEWVRRSIRFTKDVAGVETLRTAREILTIRAGDCDDINGVLLPALLSTVGHQCRLVTIASVPQAPKEFSHIYCEVFFAGRWIPLDSARHAAAFGKGPQSWFRKRVWSINDSDYVDVQGLNGYYLAAADDGSDSGFDWSTLTDLITAGTTGAANIIRATNPGVLPPGVTFARNPVTGQLVPVGPTGQLVAGTVPGGVFASGAGTLPNWMMYAGLGLLAFMVVKK